MTPSTEAPTPSGPAYRLPTPSPRSPRKRPLLLVLQHRPRPRRKRREQGAVAEATTYVPDLSPPSTQVLAPSAADIATPTFILHAQGTDAGDSGLAWIDFYVQVDGQGGYARFAHVAAGSPDSGGVYAAVANYQATADGLSHTYAFYSIGTDGAGNVEPAPSQPEATVTAQFSPPTSFQSTSFAVQAGQAERSFIQNVDVGFNLGGQPLDDLAADAATRVQLIQHNLDGSGGTVVPSSDYAVTADDQTKVLDLFFGQYGLGGIALRPRAARPTTGTR